jgi:hypothetical protein
MIEKARVYPEYHYPPERYHIDPFHNPYLPKLVIKATPISYPQGKMNFLLPISTAHNFYISQSIPIYQTEKYRIALLWREYLTKKFARSHFGFSAEYKLIESLTIKGKALIGTTSMFDCELYKKLRGDLYKKAYLGSFILVTLALLKVEVFIALFP